MNMKFPLKNASATSKFQSGITMIEVLVATLILSIGLLGLAGLQANSLRANHSAYIRSQAILIAGDAMDRMRGNRSATLNGDYNQSLTSTVPTSTTTTAQHDLNAWMTNLTSILPSGAGGISCDTNDICSVTIQWDDNRTGTQTYILSAQI